MKPENYLVLAEWESRIPYSDNCNTSASGGRAIRRKHIHCTNDDYLLRMDRELICGIRNLIKIL
jgi:hypothetical protein